MGCSNCFNGCSEIVSDQCVKYTGIDVPVLGIKTGDSLSYVEQALIEFLTSVLDGTGIKIDIPNQDLCDLVKNNLPTCGDITAVDLFIALIKSVCDLQEQVTAIGLDVSAIQNQLAALEASYNVGCLSTVNSNSGTHAILQQLITEFCAFVLDVETNYVQIADLNTLIQAYLDSLPSSNKYYTKMVPYTVVEFWGNPTGKFDVTGAGIGDWEKIYLCNGNNGTPDKRGRVTVGATSGMGGGAFDPAVNPAISGNPSYSLNTTNGSNTVTLSAAQIPSHAHTGTATSVAAPHTHFTVLSGAQVTLTSSTPIAQNSSSTGNLGYALAGTTGVANIGLTSPSSGTVTTTIVIDPTGGGGSHPNVQPSIACYYIMYIP